jgi:hydrogenase/urease accessory protein HupE
MKRSSLILAVLAAALIAVGPEAAWAHGIADSARDKSIAEFLPLGIEHMLLGWDHLLFIAGVVLLAGDLKRAAKLISLFVAGHSVTLLVATMGGWQISATMVDVVIALSVVFVGVIGLRDGPRDWRLIGVSVLGFGLIHGLGLSTRLQHLGLPEDGLLWRVVAFNVGVEVGQLLALSAILILMGYWRRTDGFFRHAYTANVAMMSAGFVLIGMQLTGYFVATPAA